MIPARLEQRELTCSTFYDTSNEFWFTYDHTTNAEHICSNLDDTPQIEDGCSELDTSDEPAECHSNPEPGESTPIAFAPNDPMNENHSWSLVLDTIVKRMISAARETPTGTIATSLPPTVAEQSTVPTSVNRSQHGSTPGHPNGPPNRPVKRDTPNQLTINTTRTSDSNDTSLNCSLGDPEKPKGPINGSPHQFTNPDKDRQQRLSDRQSPTNTAVLAHQGNPPDEDFMPKRVADSERPHPLPDPHYDPNQRTSNITTAPPPPPNAVTGTQYTTALNIHSSPQSRSRTDYTEGYHPRPTAPEETVEETFRSATQQITLALAKRRSTIDQMCTDIIKHVQHSKECIMHLHTVKKQIIHHKRWKSILSLFHDCDDPHQSASLAEQLRSITIDPLLHCVSLHYEQLIETHIQKITHTIELTSKRLCHSDTPHISNQDTTTALLDSIHNLSNFLVIKLITRQTLQ